MFTPGDRARLKSELIEAATADPLVSSAALFGSSAEGAEDEWSDIDLGLEIVDGGEVDSAIGAWTEWMYGRQDAVHHVDVGWDGVIYRVFLLASTLQVDLSFWPASSLGARGPRFRLLFGSAAEADPPSSSEVEYLVGMSWLYLLHARSNVARGRELQAQHFLQGARDQILALACASRGLPTNDARGADDLPDAVKEVALRLSVPSSDRAEFERTLAGLVEMLRDQIREAAPDLLGRLESPLRGLASRD